jgi:DNA-binding CsgD family transcriptional regulator
MTSNRNASRSSRFASLQNPLWQTPSLEPCKVSVCARETLPAPADIQAMNANAMASMFDLLAFSVFLMNGAGEVLHMNCAAGELVSRHCSIRIVANRLVVQEPGANALIQQAIAGFSDASSPNAGARISVALKGARSELIATLSLLNGPHGGWPANPKMASIAMFVQEPRSVLAVPGEAFSKLYGLTRAELRVVLSLASNLAVQEIADELGVAATTVRSHLKSVFLKTGIKRQSDLLQLIARAAPLLI